MTVFITGMFRSGSTWSFNSVRELLLHKYARERIHVSASNDTTETLLEAANKGSDAVVMKSHLLDGTGKSLIRVKAAWAIHTFRDPADAIRSGMHAFNWSFEECLRYVARSFELMDLIVKVGNGCLIFFEDIQRRPRATIEVLSEYLGISADSETIASIDRSLRPEAIKAYADKLASNREAFEATGQIVDLGFSYYDAETLFHRRHIGADNYTASVSLTASQLQTIRNSFGAHLDENGRLRVRHSSRLGSAAEINP